MPTALGRSFPPKVITHPPHMSAEDLPIYRRWAVYGLKGAIWQFFDVGLGVVDIPHEHQGKPLGDMWEKVNQKRADAVIEYEDHVKIVEFRHEASPNAIGRILTYGVLWKDDPVIDKPHRLLIVSNRMDKDVDRLARALGIAYEVV